MSHYKSNLRDIEFNLFELFKLEEKLGQGAFENIDAETARSILAEVERLSTEDLAASFVDSDRNPPVYDPKTYTAPLPESFKKSLAAWDDAEFWRLGLPEGMGGTMAPSSFTWALGEMVMGANPSIFMYGVAPMFASVIWANGNERDKRWAKFIVDNQWGASMVLTEPDAGSDVGAGRTKATPNDDGSWNIEGVKRFITVAEHDAYDNIMHMVLARPHGVEGAGGPGTKGLSLFLVPKYHFDSETGELTGERNGVYTTNLEHKMGIKVSNTCELTFGDPAVGGGEPAKGWLLGEVHNGIAQMFNVIENARMMVGTKAIATLSTGYLNALDYAKSRVQGSDLTQAANKTAPRVTITHHPDVR
ncbi:MAG TPA: acyl-CoA dehydrogenase family protein, partial [Marmoricola sp.]|nr:acyl-CoA dehydrogenase family protein [Marmoricola sp.]